jgi:hypothetical protein
MKRVVLVFGLISGVIASAMMFLTLPLIHRGVINHKNGEVIGYTSIFLAMIVIFFGIRAYREQNGGTISFGRAFAVGILITLVSSLFYVVSWEILYYNFMPDFADKYATWTADEMREKGASAAEIEAKRKEIAGYKKLWDNPLINAAMTIIEPLPVGVIVTLVSAGILRRRRRSPAEIPA